MTNSYQKACLLQTPEETEQSFYKKPENLIRLPIRNVPAFGGYFELSSETAAQEDINQSSPPKLVEIYANNNKEDKFNFTDEVEKIWKKTYSVPLPTNRKTHEADMTPFRIFNFLKDLATTHQPEQTRTKWIFIFGVIFIVFCILIVSLLFFGEIYYTTIFFSIFFLIITLIAYKAQKRRIKIRKSDDPRFGKYNKEEFKFPEDSDHKESPSAIFAKPPTNAKSDNMINQSLNINRFYATADRPTADVSKDQHGKTFDYDQSYVKSLKTLRINSVAFNKYLNNLKSFIPKVILSKLVKEMHKDDPRIVSMLTVPKYERYLSYTKARIISLANSHSLAGHFGDKGDRYDEREWTTDLPSDNQIILHILDVWFSNFINGRKKESNNSSFTEKYVYIKKEPVIENEEDVLYLRSDDWAHFYVYTSYPEGKGLQEFYAPSGRDAMYAGLTLFFWFVKTKKKSFLDGADLSEDPINIDRIFSLDRLD